MEPRDQRAVSSFGEKFKDYSGDDLVVGRDAFSLARHNRLVLLKDLLINGFDPDTQDDYGNTILCIACQNGLKGVAKAAMRHRGKINHQNFLGNTPLHFCFAFGYGGNSGV